jgi:hypothetical protein
MAVERVLGWGMGVAVAMGVGVRLAVLVTVVEGGRVGAKMAMTTRPFP